MLPCRESWGEAAPGLKGMGWCPGEWRALETTASTNFYCWGGTLCKEQNGSWYWDSLCLYKGLSRARVSLHLEEKIKKDFVFFIFSKTKTLLSEPLHIFPLIKVKKLRLFLYKLMRSTGTLSPAQTGF